MRVNEKEEDSSDKALWDPLWEYILDDHDSIEEASLTRRKLLSRPARRQKETKNESSLFDLFFDNESDSSQESRYDYRDEKSSRSKDNKSSSKRRSQLTEDAGVDNSMWAFFSKESKVVQEKPPPTTVRATKLRTRQIIQTEDELQKTNKKSGLFRRFRKSKDPGAVTTDSKKQQVRVTVTQASAPASQASSMKKTQSQKQETIDPFQMFLEVAGRLDPFGSDDDSDSETATYDDATELYDLTASGAEMDRLVDEVRCGTPKNEILLNFKPTGNDFEEDQFESIEGREPMITDFGEKSLAESGAQAMSSTVDTISELGSTADEPREGVSKVSSTPSFRNFATDKREGPERQVEYPRLSHLDFRKKSATQRFGLKRLVCCSVKTHQHDVPPSILMGGKRETLPSIPITSDDASETQKIMGSNSNTSNNLMGVSSDQLVQSRGPQSFYAYEHDTQEHLDVFYTAMGLKPRSSLVVRKLGGPPPLIPSNMRDEVIVQVNVSIPVYSILGSTFVRS